MKIDLEQFQELVANFLDGFDQLLKKEMDAREKDGEIINRETIEEIMSNLIGHYIPSYGSEDPDCHASPEDGCECGNHKEI